MLSSNNKFKFILGPESVQGSDEWIEFRKDKIGSSDVPIILGLSPFESPRCFWNRRITGESIEANFAMRRGTHLEASARDILNKSLWSDYQPCVIQSVENPSLIASLDGLFVDREGKVHIVEIKCPGAKTHGIAKAGIIPEHYIPQLCHQCMVSGAESCLYVSWDGYSDSVVTIKYTPDSSMCEKIKNQVNEFLESLNGFNSPEPQNRDWIECNDSGLIDVASRYVKVADKISDLEKEREFLRETLISKMQHPKTVVNGLKIQKSYRNGGIDYASIPQLEGVNLEMYRKPHTEIWKISLDQ